jgi:hypothetical protein
MIVTAENRITPREIFPCVTLSNTKLTRPDLRLNAGLHDETAASNHLSHGTTFNDLD